MHINPIYQKRYADSINDPESFWAEQAAELLTWSKRWETVKVGSFETFDVEWFKGGELNASYNCLDKHLEKNKNKIAIIWESDDGKAIRHLTYEDLHRTVCQFANVLKTQQIKKGDRVCIYLPMIPEVIVAMLACARIGAIHSVVFAGFSSKALKTRLQDAEAKIVITADESIRGGKIIPLKKNVDEAIENVSHIEKIIVVKHSGATIPWDAKQNVWYHESMNQAEAYCNPEPLAANHPLFILYTSGSTGKPKGILHHLGGYLVYVACTFKTIFNYQPQDIFWCTADVGWVTGHSYVVYGPLSQAATILIYEGIPQYPTPARCWEMVDRHQVNIFYTSPTAIRALRQAGDQWIKQTKRDSLTLLGSVGEPINPEVWDWYYHTVGEDRCPIVDTWWQTETGGSLISPLPGLTPLKAGSASWPFYGIEPAIVNEQGEELGSDQMGKLVIKQPWPGMMHTIYNDRKRFKESYFTQYPGYYVTGDIARRDQEGYYWITGREDDVIKVSGHRLGTEEIESALLTHSAVSEAAVVGVSHDIKGQGIYAFISLKDGVMVTPSLKQELIRHVREEIGAIATIEQIAWSRELPKTRSGKIMRRLLRQIANNEIEHLGDLSTLANPESVKELIDAKHENETVK